MVAATSTLLVDLPCAGCGYDLRGLPADGRCPECGGSIPESLARAAAAPRVGENVAVALHPWWRREMILAASTALAAAIVPTLALGIAVLAMPRNPEGKSWLIVALAAAWVLQWYAALKLTTHEPGVATPRWQAANCWLLRVSASAYLVIPFVYGLLPGGAGRYGFSMRFLLPLSWLVLPAVVTLAVRFRFLFRRLALPTLASNATWLGFLLAGSVMSFPAFLNVHDDTSPMELIVFLPSYQVGSQIYLLNVLTHLNDLGYGRVYLPHGAVSLLCIAIEVRLLVRLLRTPAAVPPCRRRSRPVPGLSRRVAKQESEEGATEAQRHRGTEAPGLPRRLAIQQSYDQGMKSILFPSESAPARQ